MQANARDHGMAEVDAERAAVETHKGAVDFESFSKGTFDRPRLTVDIQELAAKGAVFWTEFRSFDVVKTGDSLQLWLGHSGNRPIILDCTAEHLRLLREPGHQRLAFFSVHDAAPLRFSVEAERFNDGEEAMSVRSYLAFTEGVACRGRLIDVRNLP